MDSFSTALLDESVLALVRGASLIDYLAVKKNLVYQYGKTVRKL